MGLLDNIFRLSLRQGGDISKDMTSTGEIVYIDNSQGYDELILDLKLAISGGLTKEFSISVTDTVTGLPITEIRDSNGNSFDFSLVSTNRHNIKTSHFTVEPLAEQNIHSVLIIPISGIKTLRVNCGVAAIAVSGGSCQLTGKYILKQGITYTPSPVQKLAKFVFPGDGTTKTFGGVSSQCWIPKRAKFIFASVCVTDTNNQVTIPGEMMFFWKANPIEGASVNNINDWMGAKRNLFFDTGTYTSDWQEVAGEQVRPQVIFDSAPANGNVVTINLFAVL